MNEAIFQGVQLLNYNSKIKMSHQMWTST